MMISTKRTLPNYAGQRAASQAYFSRWNALIKAGVKPVILAKFIDRAAWDAWLAYYRSKHLETMLDLMLDKHEKTVPTMWPHEFDDMAVAPDRRLKDD